MTPDNAYAEVADVLVKAGEENTERYCKSTPGFIEFDPNTFYASSVNPSFITLTVKLHSPLLKGRKICDS